jgi:hypothetical protein
MLKQCFAGHKIFYLSSNRNAKVRDRMTTVDPFAIFEDSEEDDDGDNDFVLNETRRVAQSLAALAVIRNSLTTGSEIDDPRQNQATGSSDAKTPPSVECSPNYDRTIDWNEIKVPWSNPLFIGPIKFVDSLPFGGGRGCIADRAIPPGTLILVEKPIVSWPTRNMEINLSTLKFIMELPNAAQVIHDLEFLHPTRRQASAMEIANVDQVEKMLKSSKVGMSSEDLLHITNFASERKINNLDASSFSEDDAVRTLLALRYNALESGIFLFSAMLNHADQPNCVKFMPTAKTGYSEVRTTRNVVPGEPLTISYIPGILSHSSRRKYLWDQHRFDIGAELSPELLAMEIIGKQLPASSLTRRDEDSITCRVEKSVARLEEIYIDLVGGTGNDLPESAISLEQATYELINEAKRQLQNEKHLLLIPCLKLHVDICDLVQRIALLSFSSRIDLLGRLVMSATSLVHLQKQFHGADHFDIGRTNLDAAQAIEELLSKSPKHLLSLKLEGLDTLRSWSSLENRLRKDFERISCLYPKDAETFIKANRTT